MDLTKIKKDRFAFLLNVYKSVDGNTGYMVNMWDVGTELSFSQDYTNTVFDYLNNEGLIEPKALGGGMSITHYGVKEIEEAFTKPDRPTEHFIPVNQYNISIGVMHGGAIQQASNGTTINYTVSNDILDSVKQFAKELNAELHNLKISNAQKSELYSEIQTIEVQSNSPKPKTSILKETLLSVKTILESTIAGVAADLSSSAVQKLLEKTSHLITTLGS